MSVSKSVPSKKRLVQPIIFYYYLARQPKASPIKLSIIMRQLAAITWQHVQTAPPVRGWEETGTSDRCVITLAEMFLWHINP